MDLSTTLTVAVLSVPVLGRACTTGCNHCRQTPLDIGSLPCMANVSMYITVYQSSNDEYQTRYNAKIIGIYCYNPTAKNILFYCNDAFGNIDLDLRRLAETGAKRAVNKTVTTVLFALIPWV